MLFSTDNVAQTINGFFEPVWESVRAVPLVKIDFGNGKVITRTLNGNIATSVCTADGQVLDIMAGIYAPREYMANLRQFSLLAKFVDQDGKEKRAEKIKTYHEIQEAALKNNGEAGMLVNNRDMSKREVIEKAVVVLLTSVPPANKAVNKAKPIEVSPKLEKADDLANWKVLAEDTRINETIRRQEVHALLKEAGLVSPDKVTKRLYKDILHADLDDPYLGLGETLFANYPFAKEDLKN